MRMHFQTVEEAAEYAKKLFGENVHIEGEKSEKGISFKVQTPEIPPEQMDLFPVAEMAKPLPQDYAEVS